MRTLTSSSKSRSFNTQPPEGGCLLISWFVGYGYGFNTQPPEGGCVITDPICSDGTVSTHSRLKAAVLNHRVLSPRMLMFQHTAACGAVIKALLVSTHSRLKAAVLQYQFQRQTGAVSTHSRLKAAVKNDA